MLRDPGITMDKTLPVYRNTPAWQALALSLALHALLAGLVIGLALATVRETVSSPAALQLVLMPDAGRQPARAVHAPAPQTRHHAPAAVSAPVVASVANVSPAAEQQATPPAPAAMPESAAPAPMSMAAAPNASTAFFAASADAAYLHNPRPEYPHLARQRGLEGTVILRVVVSSSGAPLAVSVLTSSRSGLLDDAAVAAVSLWRFAPAHRGKETLEDTVQVPVRFSLHDQG